MGTTPKRYVLVDRDGVLNRDRADSVRAVDQFEWLPGAAEAVAALNAKGYGVLVVTNQGCVGRGDVDGDTLEKIHLAMLESVAEAGGWIAAIFVCPHTDDDGCDCRKPKTGLIDRARRRHGFDPAETWMVGDDLRDVEAARAAGCRPVLVRTGKGSGLTVDRGVAVYDDLAAFAAAVDVVKGDS